MDPITVDSLKTIGGQTVAVALATQVIKLCIPWLRQPGDLQDNLLNGLVVAGCVGLSLYYTAGPESAGWIPAAFNGLIAALAAMKGYDVVSTGLGNAKSAFFGKKK